MSAEGERRTGYRKAPKLPTVERTIRDLDDVVMIPTPITYRLWTGGEEIREEPQAKLFPELLGEPMTLVLTGGMGGLFHKVVRLSDAIVHRGQLTLWGREGRRSVSFVCEFPADLIILLIGAHALDYEPLLPPIGGTSGMRWHCPTLPAAWRITAQHCRDVAGPGHVLIDTCEAAIAAHAERESDRRAREVAMRARGLTP